MEDGDRIDMMLVQRGDIGTWGDHVDAPGTALLVAGRATAAESRALMKTLGATTDAFESHADAKLLDATACAALVAYADARQTGESDLKLDLTREDLAACVGAAALDRLLAFVPFDNASIKLRRVEPAEKLINFHTDVTPRTVQIPLVDDTAYAGGRLVFATREGLVAPPRPAGSATIHTNRVAHGVTPHTRGTRYALFFLETAADAPALPSLEASASSLEVSSSASLREVPPPPSLEASSPASLREAPPPASLFFRPPPAPAALGDLRAATAEAMDRRAALALARSVVDDCVGPLADGAFGLGGGALTYGEIEIASLDRLLRAVAAAAPVRVFADVGCGRGATVLAAALLFPNLEASRGVEVEPAAAAAAAAALERYSAHPFSALACRVSRADGLADRASWRGADAVYCCWTMFPASLRQRFADAFAEELAPGARVAVLSHAAAHPRLSLGRELEVSCSWSSRVPAFVYTIA